MSSKFFQLFYTHEISSKLHSILERFAKTRSDFEHFILSKWHSSLTPSKIPILASIFYIPNTNFLFKSLSNNGVYVLQYLISIVKQCHRPCCGALNTCMVHCSHILDTLRTTHTQTHREHIKRYITEHLV